MANTLIDDSLALQRLPTPKTSIISMADPNALTRIPTPVSPIVSKQINPGISATQNRLAADQSSYANKLDSGSGISQIHSPILRGLARIGDTAERIILPRAEQFTPGTEGNHERLLSMDSGRIGQDIKNLGDQARTQQEQALTDYTLQRPQIEQSKIDQRERAVQERVGQAAAARGQKVAWGEDGLPSFEDDHDSQAFKDHQALSAMHEATATKSQIMADIQKNHYIPGTPEWAEAQKKLAQVDQRLQVAYGSLGLRAKGLALREQNQDATLYGTDAQGNPLPGSAQITGENGNTTTIGSKFAPTAIKQQNKVNTFNDLTGSVSHLRDAIKAYEAEGGDMSDSRLAAAAADPQSTVGKVIQGKLITGGLSPAAISLLNAQRQTMEQAGILRSTTGGTSSEAGAQRILDVVPKFGSDTNRTAYDKLLQQEEVLKRLAPGQTHVTGGVSVHHPGGNKDDTVTMQAPDGSKQSVPRSQVDHYKKLGAKVVQ